MKYPFITILDDDFETAPEGVWVIRDYKEFDRDWGCDVIVSSERINKLTPEFKTMLNNMVGKGNWLYRPHGAQRLCFKTESGLAAFILKVA